MPREGVSPLSAGSHTASLLDELFESPAIRRLVANTLMAQKHYAAANALCPEDVRSWAMVLGPSSLAGFYVRGSLSLGEFEGLVHLAMGLS